MKQGNERLVSQNRLNSIMEAVDAAILTIDSSGVIVECNEATCRMFGYDTASMVGHNVKMLMPQPYRSEHNRYIASHIATGVNRIIGSGRQVTGLHQSGATIPLHLSVAKFTDNNELYFTGILHDLTELDEALSISQRLGRIIEESVNEVYTFDAKTLRFTSGNPAALNNLGYSPEELLAITPVEIVESLEKSALLHTMRPLVEGRSKRASLTSRLKRKDGSVYDAEITLHYSTALKPPEMAAIVQDVTEKNRLIDSVRRNQRMESIGNLTGGIAHDFNNILTVIMGNLDLLHDEIDDPENVELLEDAQGAAEMGTRLTSRLLAFARRSPLSPHRTNVNRLITDLSEMLKRTLGSSISLENSLADDLWDTDIDVSELENALVNLAINARDAMPDGGRLLIETANCSLDDENILGKDLQPGDYVRVSVTDTGTGIPDELKDTIFEPFVTSKKGGKGSGLGLSMVYGFASQSGGCISVYTEVDVGTVFSLYLPRSGGEGENTLIVDEEPGAPLSGGKTILVVEDDERVRNLTLRRIKKLGHTAIEAADGYQALELYRQNQPIDLVFSDVVMTEGMTGYDLAIAIREIDPDTPILLTSGYAEDIINADKLEESNLSLLRKPYHQKELEEALDICFA
jgi:PAS domain S-box-containing protein